MSIMSVAHGVLLLARGDELVVERVTGSADPDAGLRLVVLANQAEVDPVLFGATLAAG